MDNADEPDRHTLAEMLEASRARTLGLWRDMREEWLLGPKLAIVNPPLWELGHLGWFQEHWCLRHRDPGEKGPSLIRTADALYDSAGVAHATRWTLPLPDFEETLDYLDRVLDLVLERIDLEGDDDRIRYRAQLVVFHEQMHCEAFTYTRQTLGYPIPPNAPDVPAPAAVNSIAGEVQIPGGRFMLGADPGSGFVFDNEKWAHEVEVGPFSMARCATTFRDYLAFVEDGGYQRHELWSVEGWAWREATGATRPLYWCREGGVWFVRRHDNYVPLPFDAAMIHVNAYEAEAWCRWARRRLPTEAEWELAAATAPGDLDRKRRYPWGNKPPSLDLAALYGAPHSSVDAAAFAEGESAWGIRQMLGNVWEWTASVFQPYPGFVIDPYAEYSAPWFGDHRVLRGGCFATDPALIRNTWRNFYKPDRRDVFAGFRTCAI